MMSSNNSESRVLDLENKRISDNTIKNYFNMINDDLIGINFSFNQLTKLSNDVLLELSKLKNLKALNLNSNTLMCSSKKEWKQFPRSLTFLSLSNNRDLTYMPQIIEQLSDLQFLDISNINFSRLNDSEKSIINFKFPKLIEHIDLENTRISKIPKYLYSLPKLKYLILNNNFIGKFKISKKSPILTDLPLLESLELKSNQLKQVPSQISSLPSLENLNLKLNKLTSRSLSRFSFPKTLKNLNLASNSGITSFPKSILKLSDLETLDISGTMITKIPPSITKLSKLKLLDISGTSIEKLPPSFKNLPKNITINIENTPITSLPKELCKKWYNDGEINISTDVNVGYNELCSSQSRKSKKLK